MSSSLAFAQEENTGVTEEFQDWRLQCSQADNASQTCLLRQEQTRENGERLLVVEISKREGSTIRGTALLPFGILFDRGVVLQIDDRAEMDPLSFRTCLPTGCIATFEIDQSMLGQLRMGTALAVKVMTVNGQEMSFPVSLSGFTSATNRLSQLTGL
ncbi:invasion associated locus B family protein [Aliihoeflea sp. PC F10.4]